MTGLETTATSSMTPSDPRSVFSQTSEQHFGTIPVIPQAEQEPPKSGNPPHAGGKAHTQRHAGQRNVRTPVTEEDEDSGSPAVLQIPNPVFQGSVGNAETEKPKQEAAQFDSGRNIDLGIAFIVLDRAEENERGGYGEE